MGVLKNLVKTDADSAHSNIATLIEVGLHSSHALTGAIVVTNQAKDTVLLRETESYHSEGYHVEQGLLAKLFDFSKSSGVPFKLPANSRVYLYVYNSPCAQCVGKLSFALRVAPWGSKNPTVVWKLGFTKLYLQPDRRDGYPSAAAARDDYNARLLAAGWQWKQV